MNRIKEHFRSMNRVKTLHGLKAVIGIYLSKIPFSEKIARLLGGMKIKTTILGSTMYLDVFDKGLHRRLLLKGIREEEHVNQIKENIKPGMTGVELGANIGYFGLLEARIVGERGKVYCIEPAPDNFRALMRNIEANSLQNIMQTSQYLIGDHNGTEKLYLSEFANVHSLSPKREQRGFVNIPMVTLDTFMEKNNISPEGLNFIRMDIEGYEVMAFQGMKKLFEAGKPLKIFMEFHPMYYHEWGWTMERLLRFLYESGFKVREIAKHREYDQEGNLKPVILKDPTLEEILKSSVFNGQDGSQAYLERV